MPICLLDSMEETWSLHETVLFRNSFETQCEEIFDHILSSYGKPRTKLIDRVVKSILVFFINSFLAMNCISGYNETNINRLLVNYSPTATINQNIVYPVVTKFNNLYWALSHAATWDSYDIFMSILNEDVTFSTVTTADITATIIFMVSVGMVRINPIYFVNCIQGNPFYIQEIISQYWFRKGLRYIELHEEKRFKPVDRMENRKIEYMKMCSTIELQPC